MVNMLYMGCSNIVVGISEDEMTTLIGCTAPQPGARDPHSTYTFIFSSELVEIPPDGIPICGDPTGMYSMLPVPIQTMIQDE
jgi:hypothetical protein